MKSFLMPVGTRFSTNKMAQHEKFSFWNDCVFEEFGHLHCVPEDIHTFQGQIQGHSLGDVSFSEVIADAQYVERNFQHISCQEAEDDYKLVLLLSGIAISTQHCHTSILNPGDYVIYDSACPFSIDFKSSYHALTLQIPRDQLNKALPHSQEFIGKVINGKSGTEFLASKFICNVALQISDLKKQMHEEVIEQINQLLSMSLRLSPVSSANTKNKVIKKARLLQIKDFIEANLSNPNLSPAYIATQNETSVRYLHKLFEKTNLSLSKYILIRRLERAKNKLAGIQFTSTPLIEIALSSGFKDAAYFSRVFKQRFGISPSNYRQTL